ncbi:MAG: DUF6350 family protein [Gordonia sp. (in: high G+C Gram-positive bacteria)]|uniref:cell division protein PerM n=1 Tax=Gordonia sp. (in: high G+C Gram-positive bacteria) TaxID=84139 RepID=UPI0039E2C146
MAARNVSLAARLRHARQVQRDRAQATAGTARELVIVAFAVPLATLLLLAVIAAITLGLSGSGFGAFGTVLGSAWLCLHQVPLSIGGVKISALPLVPTIALLVAVFRYTGPSARLRTTPADLGALVGAAVGGPLLITALAYALVLDGSSVVPVNPPNALWAFGATVLIYGLGTIAGIARRDWRDWCAQAGLTGERFDDAVAGVRTGVLAALMLIGAGGVVVCVLLAANWPAVTRAMAGGNRFDGYLGLTLVSLLYLPNLVVDVAGALLGVPVPLGGAMIDVFNPHTGSVPALPITAIAPGPPPIRYLWAVVLVVPLAVAIWAGLRARHYDPLRNLRRVAIIAAVAAVVMFVATLAAAGTVGELGRAGGQAPTVALFTFGWVLVVGAVIALLHGSREETKAQRSAAAAALASSAVVGHEDGFDDDPTVVLAVVEDVEPEVPTPAFYRPDGDTPVVDDVEDLMFFDDIAPD